MPTSHSATDRRLRVVFVDHVARLSGGEIALLRLLPTLALDVDVHVVLGEDGPLADRLGAAGIPTEVLPLSPRVRDLRKETMRPDEFDFGAVARLPPYVARLSRRFRMLRADIVHTNSLKSAVYAGAAGRMARVPVVWHLRDRIAPDYLPRSAVRLVRTASRILPSAVVANSRSTLATLPNHRRGRVLYNPIVPDGVERLASSPRPAHVRFTLGVVGRLAPWKGQHVFLRGFAEAFGGTEVRGRVIGSAMFGEQEYEHALRRQAETLGIADQIEFRGFREDVWGELDELDILVHCSVTPEPFGQVVLEGMAARLAVIASAGGGPAELITDGIDGILTPPRDVGELARAMSRLYEDGALREQVSAAAQKRASQFTPDRTARQLLEVYASVVNR